MDLRSQLDNINSLFDQRLKVSQVILTAGEQRENGYAPFPLAYVKANEPSPFDVYLKVKPKNSPQAQIIRCCPKGEVFAKKWLLQLIQLKITDVYFSNADIEIVLTFLEKHLKDLVRTEQRTVMEKAIFVYDALHNMTKNFFNVEQLRINAQVKSSLKFLDDLFEFFQGEQTNINLLLAVRQQNSQIYTHCLNVSFIGMSFISHLGWQKGKALAFGLGALFHDIGATEVPLAILQKRGKLDDEERTLLERHPTRGFQILRNFPAVWPETLMMVAQHHENGDGSGYPEKLRLNAISPMARILRIIDRYEYMTSGRPWCPPLTPAEALSAMCNEYKLSQKFDPVYLKAFINFLFQWQKK